MKGERREEAHRWLQQGLYDMRAAEWNAEGGFYDTACFLSQQSAEKVLKSLLYYLGARRKALFTHSLAEMIIEGCKQVDDLRALLDAARRLDLHYIPSRYPNGLPSGYPHKLYSKSIADEAIAGARSILEAVRDFYIGQNEAEILQEE